MYWTVRERWSRRAGIRRRRERRAPAGACADVDEAAAVRKATGNWSMTSAISGWLLTAAATLASSWLMMRAISRADLVSKLERLRSGFSDQLLEQGAWLFFVGLGAAVSES